jgi:hypothetical protein
MGLFEKVIPIVTLVDYVYRTIKLMNIRRNVNLDGVERVAYNDAGLTATTSASAAAICYLAVNNGTISGQNIWAASRARAASVTTVLLATTTFIFMCMCLRIWN